ncbi:MAG: hypothetical protein LBC87_04060 [Fibromonadaceae bacterium]|jgi:hypothetical protein|nr:hypothetical protein [Fibromonadaceae bacterium]
MSLGTTGTGEVLSKPVVTICAAKMNEEMGEFSSVAKELRPETKEKGSNIEVYVRKPSQVYSGMAGLPASGAVENPEQKVNVVLDTSFTYDSLSVRDLSNDVLKREEQILAPMRTAMQYDLKSKFYYGLMSAGDKAIAAETQGKLTWGDLARALAAVRHSGVGGKLNILIPENGFAALMGSTQNAFLPSTNEEMFKNRLGSFGGADVWRTVVDGIIPDGTGNFTVRSTDPWGNIPGTGEGLGSQSYIGTTATSGIVQKGTMFQIDGVQAKNIYGKTSGQLSTFTCLYDIDLSTGKPVDPLLNRPQLPAGSIPLGRALGIGFLSAPVAAGATLIRVNDSTTPLNSVLVYSEKAFAFASATPARRYVVEEENTAHEGGINIRLGINGSNENGLTSFRMDVLTGSNGVWSPGCCAILY